MDPSSQLLDLDKNMLFPSFPSGSICCPQLSHLGYHRSAPEHPIPYMKTLSVKIPSVVSVFLTGP